MTKSTTNTDTEVTSSIELSKEQIHYSNKTLLDLYGITENNLGKYQDYFGEMPYLYFLNTLDQWDTASIALEIQDSKNSGTNLDKVLLKLIQSKAKKYNLYKAVFDTAMKKSEDENYQTTSDIDSIEVPSRLSRLINADCSTNSIDPSKEIVLISSKSHRLACKLISIEERNYVTICSEYIKHPNDTFDIIEYGQGDYGFKRFGAPNGINIADRSNRYVIQGLIKTGTIPTEGGLLPMKNLYYLDLFDKEIKSMPINSILKKFDQGERILYFIDNDIVALGTKEELPSNGEKEITGFTCSQGIKKLNYELKHVYKYTVMAEFNLTTGVRTEK